MQTAGRSDVRAFVGSVLLLVGAGWLFYFFGVEAFLEAAYAGESWSYFNEYAARWRGRQPDPTLDAFLQRARTLLFRYAVLGTTGLFLLLGLYWLRPRAFTSYFSTEESPYNLALFRIVLFGALLAQDLESVEFFAQLPESLQFPPPGLSFILPFVSTDPTLVAALKVVFWVACICGLLGAYTRVSTVVALLSGLYVMGIPQLYGKVNHYHHLIWFTALLVPSRCADVLSVDALRRTRGDASPSPPSPAPAYAVPLRYVWLLVGLIYFFPGFWKFVSEGFAWAFSENLKFQMYTQWFTKAYMPFFRVDRYPLLYQAGAAGTLLFELGFTFALPFRSARPWAAAVAFSFHESTRIFLSIHFWTVYPALLFLFDVRKHLVTLGRWCSPSRLTLIYDEDESWQRRVVGMLLHLDVLDRLTAHAEASAERADGDPGPEEGAKCLAVSASALAVDAVWTGGHFAFRKGLRVVAHVPPALLLLPFAPFATRALGAGPSSRSTPTAGTRALHLVGGVLLVANVICGMAKIYSYPFTAYPTFAVMKDSTVTTLRVTGTTASGKEVDVLRGVQDHTLAGFAPGRLRGLFRSIFRVDDADERTRKLRALWTVLRRERADLRAITTVTFYEATYSNNPDRRSDPLLSERLITTFDVSPAEASRPAGTEERP